MAEEHLDAEPLAVEDDAPLRDRKSNSKALRTLGLDTSAVKQRKMLGLDEEEHNKALQEAAERLGEPLVGGHSIVIPDEQIEAQLHARRRRRASSYHPSSPHSSRHTRRNQPSASSSDNVGEDRHDDDDPKDSDSIPSHDYSSDNEPFSDGAARFGRRSVRSGELEDQLAEFEDHFDLDRRRWRSPSARGLIDADHEEGPLSTSAPHRYFYYYYDGQRRQPRRRRASFAGEHTPMIDRRANRKALTILGINPSEEKVMDILGLEQAEDLESAVAAALAPAPAPDLPQGRPLQPKALSTLGVPPPPSKADVLLGRIESSYEQLLLDSATEFQLHTPFI